MRRARAAVVGYQGYWNLGDEAILAGIENLLTGSGLDVVTVFSGLGAVSAFKHAKRVHLRRLLPGASVLHELHDVDWLIVAGGGLLNDYWLRAIPRYFAWVVAARLMRVHVIWLGVGVGPIHRAPLRLLVNLTAALSDLVTVRDRDSRTLVGAHPWHVPVQIVPDPAFFIAVTPYDGPRSGVALILRPPAPNAMQQMEPLIQGFVEVAGRLVDETREHVTLITMGGKASQGLAGQADAAFVSEVQRLALAQRPEADIRVVELGVDPTVAIDVLAHHRLTVSMRLHGLILSSLAGTPCLPIAYDSKVLFMARRLGLEEVTLGLADVHWAILDGALHELDALERRLRTQTALQELRSEAPALRELVRRVVAARHLSVRRNSKTG